MLPWYMFQPTDHLAEVLAQILAGQAREQRRPDVRSDSGGVHPIEGMWRIEPIRAASWSDNGQMPASDLTLKDGRIVLDCGLCGAGGAHPPHLSDTVCGVCQGMTCHRSCPKCRSLVSLSPEHTTPNVRRWCCFGCGYEGRREAWRAAAVEQAAGLNPEFVQLYAVVGLDLRAALLNPHRRRVDGSVIAADGFSGRVSGGATIIFEAECALVMVGDLSRPVKVPYERLTSLQIDGPGLVHSTTGGGWSGGGFGLTGALQGVAMAHVLNAVTTRHHTSVESVVNVQWPGAGLSLLNTMFLPEHLLWLLHPVLQRVDEARAQAATAPRQMDSTAIRPAPADLAAQLASLAAMRESGVLTEEEFLVAKARLLG